MISPYYINLFGKFGSRFYDYTTLSELLEQMDRLGVWQTTATCHIGNMKASNQQLLEELQNTPGAKERVIPAFIADPHIYLSHGEMEHLTMCLTTCRPSCLRLLPKTNVFRLREIEQVLLRLEHLHPVILIEKAELENNFDIDDLIMLANRFPTMSFVVQRVMWNPMHLIFDAMQRANNIYMDSSFLHTREGYKVMTEALGKERILFSLGLRANHGAPIAGLAYASIPQEQKDAIASDNFIRLFKDAKDRQILESNRKAIPNRVANSYWNRLLAQQPLGTPIIDSHAHILPSSAQWMAQTNDMQEQAQNISNDMDRLGVERIYVSNTIKRYADALFPNRELLRVTEPYRHKMRGYLLYFADCPELYTPEYLEEMFSTGFYIGFKSLPKYQEVSILDERYEPMFRYAHEHNLPILLHSWDGMPYGTVQMCSDAAKKWPNAKVILGHSGGTTDARNVCHKIARDPAYNNVYFEFCGSFLSNIDWKTSLEYIDHHRILYGTDTHLHDPVWELGRLLSEDIPDQQLQDILAGNARRLFGE